MTRRPRLAAALQQWFDVTTTTESTAKADAQWDAARDIVSVPVANTIEPRARQISEPDGVRLRDLQAGTMVTVETRHSTYRIVVLDGPEQRVLVSGGAFEAGTEVRADGATAGGSMLKTGWIGIGLRLELMHGQRRIVTSRVRSITINTPPSPVSSQPG